MDIAAFYQRRGLMGRGFLQFILLCLVGAAVQTHACVRLRRSNCAANDLLFSGFPGDLFFLDSHDRIVVRAFDRGEFLRREARALVGCWRNWFVSLGY